jgi:protein-tyrosine phosphatase
MVWQETTEVAVIVMLTQISESGHEKCFQYFPADTTDDILIDNEVDEFKAQIRLLELTTDESERITTRKLLMTVKDESRIIWHLSFSGWPDFGVPEDGDRLALFELLHMSREKNGLPENPRIVHCSAGVGRSGTFIALDHLLKELDAGAVATAEDEEDMIFNTVNKLREQRMMMVQSDAQYLFLYDVLKDRFEEEQAIVVPSPLSTDAPMETTESNSERSPKVARLARAVDAVTVDYSGKQPETVSVVPIGSS